MVISGRSETETERQRDRDRARDEREREYQTHIKFSSNLRRLQMTDLNCVAAAQRSV